MSKTISLLLRKTKASFRSEAIFIIASDERGALAQQRDIKENQ